MTFLQNEILNKIYSSLQSQLENLIIEGLKRKGYQFENKKDLEDFVKTRCRRTDNIQQKQCVYYVDDTPFFLHNYEVVNEQLTEHNNGIKMSANYGTYSYL